MTIQDIFSGAGVEYLETGHHHCREGWIQTKLCPWCDSRNYHLGFNVAGKFFFCWRCRWHPTFVTLTRLGVPYSVAKASFAELETDEIPTEKKQLGKFKEPAGVAPMLGAHRRYLENRNFDPDEIEKVWRVQGIGMNHRLNWRLYIPIFDRGIRVSWTTRAIGDKVELRYISAPPDQAARNLKHLIYGLDFCQHSIVVVEGPTDAWNVGPGAGALFGTAFTPAQIRLLAKIPYRYICFDDSNFAQARARELSALLAVFPGETFNVQLNADDPGSASKKEINWLRRFAKL